MVRRKLRCVLAVLLAISTCFSPSVSGGCSRQSDTDSVYRPSMCTFLSLRVTTVWGLLRLLQRFPLSSPPSPPGWTAEMHCKTNVKRMHVQSSSQSLNTWYLWVCVFVHCCRTYSSTTPGKGLHIIALLLFSFSPYSVPKRSCGVHVLWRCVVQDVEKSLPMLLCELFVWRAKQKKNSITSLLAEEQCYCHASNVPCWVLLRAGHLWWIVYCYFILQCTDPCTTGLTLTMMATNLMMHMCSGDDAWLLSICCFLYS